MIYQEFRLNKSIDTLKLIIGLHVTRRMPVSIKTAVHASDSETTAALSAVSQMTMTLIVRFHFQEIYMAFHCSSHFQAFVAGLQATVRNDFFFLIDLRTISVSSSSWSSFLTRSLQCEISVIRSRMQHKPMSQLFFF
jgi:hypothetical protein